MPPDESGGEKTLPATATKREQQRQEGNVAKSQDLNSAAGLTMALLLLFLFGHYMLETLVTAGRFFLANAWELSPGRAPTHGVTLMAMYYVALCVLPFMGAMVVVGVTLNLLQVGVLFTAKPMQPKLNRINPITGLRRYFSIRALVELAKSLAKLAVVGVVVWLAMRDRMEEFIALMALTPVQLLPEVAALVATVWWRVAAAMVIIGLLDLAFQRWQHERDIRMSVQEARRETKELEGDPHIKRRVRQLQRQMAMQRMLTEVPEADVVVTNPTHYAVALRYDMARMEAPVVVAKGERLLARRIRDLAAEHDVPVVRNPELARALYRTIDVGKPVPEQLFRTVAEVLSYVYRIDRRASKRRERRPFMGALDREAV